MVDFKKALETGLNANADATAKRAEIRAVVDDVSRALQEATAGAIAVGWRTSKREVVRRLNGMAALIAGADRESSTVKYTALVAERLVEPKTWEELAEVELDPAGYPVMLTAPNTSGHAFDRDGFERALAILLEHPDTGGKIQKLLDLGRPPASTPAADPSE